MTGPLPRQRTDRHPLPPPRPITPPTFPSPTTRLHLKQFHHLVLLDQLVKKCPPRPPRQFRHPARPLPPLSLPIPSSRSLPPPPSSTATKIRRKRSSDNLGSMYWGTRPLFPPMKPRF